MTHIHERLFVQCPYVRAREYLRDLPFTAPLICPTSLEEDVLVRYERGRDPLHFDEPWNVYWAAEDGGAHPDFAGRLTLRSDERRGAVIELAGDFTPPFGARARTFDMLAGAKLASGTARTLLRLIAESMEDRFRRDEAARMPA